MVDEEDKKEDLFDKEDKFDAFTPEGEALGYISLDQARVLAIQHARENTDFYGRSYQGVELYWEVVSQEETEDYYEIRLSYRAGPGLPRRARDRAVHRRQSRRDDRPPPDRQRASRETKAEAALRPRRPDRLGRRRRRGRRTVRHGNTAPGSRDNGGSSPGRRAYQHDGHGPGRTQRARGPGLPSG